MKTDETCIETIALENIESARGVKKGDSRGNGQSPEHYIQS